MGARVSRTAVLAGVIGVLLGLVVGAAGVLVVNPAESNPAESVAQQWIEGLQAKDGTAMADLFANDAVWLDGATGETYEGGPMASHAGWDGVLAGTETVKEARLIGSGDGGAVVAWVLFVTPPAGTSPMDLPGISVLEMSNGKVARETVYYNPYSAYGE